jgi:hypothetical protein
MEGTIFAGLGLEGWRLKQPIAIETLGCRVSKFYRKEKLTASFI